ncbi:MAG: hypothetical protein A2126_01295 [Candidatus Woykebacteria bacterium GWB1_45_5]|uniref:Uncharacterized protein n=1 Tax=Candidatus Woykebacteria bacterium GWB1_45_5 TaxID=1802592 RepID=A0A1G1W580_9BACT|nr:MAG: hypothetical protein A2126_01295 [Candidatus Woykebacteria bacterium GWB1_45_5]
MRVFGLISLLLGGLIIVFLATKQLGLLSRPANTTQPINQASTIQTKANLDAIAKKLNVYYIETGKYPTNLNELEPDSQDFSVFTYQLCSSDKSIIRLGSTTMVLTNGNAVLDDAGGC